MILKADNPTPGENKNVQFLVPRFVGKSISPHFNVLSCMKNLPAMQNWVWFLGWEDPLEEGTTSHSNILAWRIPWTEKPGGLQSTGSQGVGHDWIDLARRQSFWIMAQLSDFILTWILCKDLLSKYGHSLRPWRLDLHHIFLGETQFNS